MELRYDYFFFYVERRSSVGQFPLTALRVPGLIPSVDTDEWKRNEGLETRNGNETKYLSKFVCEND